MYRPICAGITNIEVPNPDWCHWAGEILTLPWSMNEATRYRVDRIVSALTDDSSWAPLKRLAALVISIYYWQITIPALLIGSVLKVFSKTYMAAFRKIQAWNIGISWTDNHRPLIKTAHLTLRPITADDLPAYLDLFGNQTATQWMEERAGYTPANITAQFNQWLTDWETQPFSAFAVVDGSNRVIGHAMLSPGAFEAQDQGYARMSIVIDPRHWNADCEADYEDRSVAIEHQRHIGSEVVRALVTYAQYCCTDNTLMFVHVPPGQAIQNGNVHLNANGVVDRVQVPLTEIRASVSRACIAAQVIGERLINEIGAIRTIESDGRDRFVLQLAR